MMANYILGENRRIGDKKRSEMTLREAGGLEHQKKIGKRDKEIADETGKSPAAIKQKRYRYRKKVTHGQLLP